MKKIRPLIVGVIIKEINLTKKFTEALNNLIEDLHWALGRNKKKVSIQIHDLDTISFPIYYRTINSTTNIINYNKKSEIINNIFENDSEISTYKKLIYDNEVNLPAIVDSNNNIISLSGLIVCDNNIIKDTTKNIFIGVTGTNKEVEYSLNILTAALIDRNFSIEAVTILNEENNRKQQFPNMNPIKINVEYDDIECILGLKLSNDEIINSLKKMGHNSKIIQNGEVKYISVEAPAYRADIFHSRDIIEDIAIGYGYEKIISKPSSFYSIGKESDLNKNKKKLFEIVISLGFTQVMPFTLTNEHTQCIKMNRKNNNLTKIINPINEEQTIIRNELLPCLLEILSINKHHELPQKIFEIGETITGLKKQYNLSLVVIDSKVNFTDILEINNILFKEMNITYELKESNDNAFIKGRRADIYYLNEIVGVLGELDPLVINNFNLEYPILGLEINLNKLFNI